MKLCRCNFMLLSELTCTWSVCACSSTCIFTRKNSIFLAISCGMEKSQHSFCSSWICRKNARSFCSVSMQKSVSQAARYKDIQADSKVYIYVCAAVCDLSLQNISEFCILLLASTRIVYGVHFVLIYCYCLMPTADLTLPMLYCPIIIIAISHSLL